MISLLLQLQGDSSAVVDTLTKSYSQKWKGAEKLAESGPLMHMAASYDLIFIVLAVSLIIWFVLLFFIVRVDKKVTRLEEKVETHKTPEDL